MMYEVFYDVPGVYVPGNDAMTSNHICSMGKQESRTCDLSGRARPKSSPIKLYSSSIEPTERLANRLATVVRAHVLHESPSHIQSRLVRSPRSEKVCCVSRPFWLITSTNAPWLKLVYWVFMALTCFRNGRVSIILINFHMCPTCLLN